MRLADLPDVLTDADLIALLRISKWQFQRLVAQQNRTGLQVLPPTVPMPGGRRYLRDDVERWLKHGTANRSLRRAG